MRYKPLNDAQVLPIPGVPVTTAQSKGHVVFKMRFMMAIVDLRRRMMSGMDFETRSVSIAELSHCNITNVCDSSGFTAVTFKALLSSEALSMRTCTSDILKTQFNKVETSTWKVIEAKFDSNKLWSNKQTKRNHFIPNCNFYASIKGHGHINVKAPRGSIWARRSSWTRGPVVSQSPWNDTCWESWTPHSDRKGFGGFVFKPCIV